MTDSKDFILLIPFYNNLEGLITSLKSVQYPYSKYEVLIVDDGSKEPLSVAYLNSLFQQMSISVINLQNNVGIAKALNKGLKEIKVRNDYKYIARLDCGDTCHKDRFTEQVNFLNSHTDIALLGTWCTFTESNSKKNYIYRTKTKHKDIIKEMHFKCSFIHPTIMFRKEMLEKVGLYPENYPYAEDYAYFWEILNKFEVAILPLNLVFVSIHKNNISYQNRRVQLLTRKKIVSEMGNSFINKLLGLSYIKILSLLPVNLAYKLKYLVK